MTLLSQFLSEVEKRAEAATEGPLHLDGMTKQRWGVTARSIVDANEKEVIHADDFYLDAKEADYDLFLHAQVDIKRLVAICRELAGALERYAMTTLHVDEGKATVQMHGVRTIPLFEGEEWQCCDVAKEALSRAAALAGRKRGE